MIGTLLQKPSGKDTAPASPCIGVCTINDKTGYCAGCLRSGQEVADWLYMDNAQKKALLTKLQQRKQELG